MKKRSPNKTLKTLLMISLIGLFLFPITFAADSSTTEAMQTAAERIHQFLSLMSRGRIIFANIAGKLMTNSLIYGEAFHMDKYLFMIWTLIKNLCNFALGGFFIYYIFKVIINPAEKVGTFIKEKMTRFLITGILIQASRFIGAAILDISTIATVTIGSFPSQILSQDPQFNISLKDVNPLKKYGVDLNKNEITNEITIKRNENAGKITESLVVQTGALEKPIKIETFIDQLMPNGKSLGGALTFLGLSIINVEDFGYKNASTPTAQIIGLLIQGFSLIIYSIALLLLCITNFIRIFFLQFFIIAAPAIAFLWGMKIDIKGGSGDLFKPGTFFGLAFKPVIFTAIISITLIFTVLIQSTINKNDQEINIAGNLSIKSHSIAGKSEEGTSKTYTTTMNAGDFLGVTVNGAKKTFGDIIASLFLLVMMRFLVKAAITSKTGIKFIDDFTSNTTKSLQKFAGQMPIVPIGEGVGFDNIFGGAASGSLMDRVKGSGTGVTSQMQTKNEDNIKKLLRGENGKETGNSLTDADKKKISDSITGNQVDYGKFITTTQELRETITGGIGLKNPTWKGGFINWVNAYKSTLSSTYKRDMSPLNGSPLDEKNLDKFINNNKNKALFRETFAGENNKTTDPMKTNFGKYANQK